MWLKSNNLNKARLITLCYIEILLQVVFMIWFLYPALYKPGNNIHARVDLIQSGINLQYIPKNYGDPSI